MPVSFPCPETTSFWIEFVKLILGIVTAGTAICGLRFAKSGLDKWHAETIGKRKAALAEQVLTAFYEARDVFIGARSPWIFVGEGSARQQNLDETEKQKNSRNANFVPLERLRHKADLFAHIQALRYPFVAYFGENAAAPFDAMRQAQVEISTAVELMMQMIDENGSTAGFSSQAGGVSATLWGALERPDKLDLAIEAAVQQIERLCRPVLEKVG